MGTVSFGQRRRWVLLAAAALAVWVLLAVTVGSGGGDGEPAPDPTTTPTAAPTTTTATVDGGPALDVPAGWELVLTGRHPARAVDLSTGVVRELPFSFVSAGRPDGVFTADQRGLLWRPHPMDDASAVVVGAAEDAAHPVAGRDEAWVVTPAGRAALVSLADGRRSGEVALPAGAVVVGAAPSGLVVSGGGDTFVVSSDGSVDAVGGTPLLVTGDAVLVRRCAAPGTGLRCEVVSVPLAGGGERSVPDPSTGERTAGAVAIHPMGWPTVRFPGAPGGYAAYRPDGPVPVVPASTPSRSGTLAWTPDGRLLLVRAADAVRVVDAFAAGGPVEVGAFRLDGAVATMFVVGPAAPP